MKVKIIDHQDLSVAEKQINDFLKKVEVKELVDIKFGTRFKNDTEGHTFVILYEENMASGVEDPQIYEWPFVNRVKSWFGFQILQLTLIIRMCNRVTDT
jgi:hypothetical protein